MEANLADPWYAVFPLYLSEGRHYNVFRSATSETHFTERFRCCGSLIRNLQYVCTTSNSSIMDGALPTLQWLGGYDP